MEIRIIIMLSAISSSFTTRQANAASIDTMTSADFQELSRVKRVIGGRASHAHSHPWQVYIEVLDEEETFCGGSIIDKRFILTAAHCVTDACGSPVRKVRVRLGAHDVCSEDWTASHLVRRKRIITHPGFNHRTFDNDIAILVLKRDIKFGPKVRKVRLPTNDSVADCKYIPYDEESLIQERDECIQATNYEDTYYNEEYESTEDYVSYDYEENEASDSDADYYDEYGDYYEIDPEKEYEDSESEEDYVYNYEYKDNCTTYFDSEWALVVGWGTTSKFSGSCTLREAKLKIYPNHDPLCQDENDFVLDEDKICAYNPQNLSDSCQGDSGSGLLVFPPREPPILVGVVSHGEGCAEPDSPGVYARVQHFVEWIHTTMSGYF